MLMTSSIPETNTKFGQTTLSAYKLGTMIKISNELLHDSAFDLASYIAQMFMKCSLGISNFLEEISNPSHSIVFLYFFALFISSISKQRGEAKFRPLDTLPLGLSQMDCLPGCSLDPLLSKEQTKEKGSKRPWSLQPDFSIQRLL